MGEIWMLRWDSQVSSFPSRPKLSPLTVDQPNCLHKDFFIQAFWSSNCAKALWVELKLMALTTTGCNRIRMTGSSWISFNDFFSLVTHLTCLKQKVERDSRRMNNDSNGFRVKSLLHLFLCVTCPSSLDFQSIVSNPRAYRKHFLIIFSRFGLQCRKSVCRCFCFSVN